MKKIILILGLVCCANFLHAQAPFELGEDTISLPVANAGIDQMVSLNQSVTIGTVGVVGTVTWTRNGVAVTGTANGGALTFNATQSGYYVQHVLNAGGCSSLDSMLLSVTGTTFIITTPIPSAMCAGDSSQVGTTPTGGTGVYTYAWNVEGNATIVSTAQSFYAKPAVTTNFVITATSGAQIDRDTVTVVVNALPVANAGIDQTVSLNQSVTIGTVGVVGTVTWTRNGVAVTGTANGGALTFNATQAGYYVQHVLNAGGCSSVDSMLLNVTGTTFTITTPIPSAMCAGDSSQVGTTPTGGTGVYTYAWNVEGNATIVSTAQSFYAKPAVTTNFVITATSGAQIDRDTVTVVVNALPLNQVPTVNSVTTATDLVIQRCVNNPVTVIGLQASQNGFSYQLQLFASPNTVLNTQTSTGGAITFTPQPGKRCRIVAISPQGCPLIIHK